MNEPSDTNRGAGEGTPGETGDLNALIGSDARLQGQLDRLVGRAIEAARQGWERERGEREAQAERAREAALERELARLESALRKRELRADAAAMLGARGLPSELIDCVDADSADALEGSVAKLERAFNASIESALRLRLSGEPPKDGGGEAIADRQLRRAMGLKTD